MLQASARGLGPRSLRFTIGEKHFTLILFMICSAGLVRRGGALIRRAAPFGDGCVTRSGQPGHRPGNGQRLLGAPSPSFRGKQKEWKTGEPPRPSKQTGGQHRVGFAFFIFGTSRAPPSPKARWPP